MTRTIDAAVLTDLGLERAEKTELIELNFSGGVIRLTTAAKDLLWNAVIWQAVGGHLEVEGFGESVDAAGNGNRIKLSGVDQAILALILGQNYRGRVAKIWYAHMNQATGSVLGTPILMFDGYMNEGFELSESRGEFGGGTVDIGTRLMVRINDLVKIRGIRTNEHSHQASGYAGVSTDTFFMNVTQLPGRRIYWGVKAPSHATIPVPVGGGNGPTTNPGGNPWGGQPGGGIGGVTPGQVPAPPPPPPPIPAPPGNGWGSTPGSR